MASIGYIRVSTVEQNLSRQEDALRQIKDIERIFEDKASGRSIEHRNGLSAMMEFIRQGDVLYVESISRLARNVKDLLGIIERLNLKGVQLISLKEKIDTSTPTGVFLLQVMASMAELERNALLERQREGVDSARLRGKHLGRPRAEKPKDWEKVISAWKAEKITATAAMKSLGMTRTTFYKLAKAS